MVLGREILSSPVCVFYWEALNDISFVKVPCYPVFWTLKTYIVISVPLASVPVCTSLHPGLQLPLHVHPLPLHARQVKPPPPPDSPPPLPL